MKHKQAIINIAILSATIAVTTGQALGHAAGWIDPDTVGVLAGAAYSVAATVYLTYKNTNITKPAQHAQAYIKALKKGIHSLSDEEKGALKQVYSNCLDFDKNVIQDQK
jgi:hypothetical protein